MNEERQTRSAGRFSGILPARLIFVLDVAVMSVRLHRPLRTDSRSLTTCGSPPTANEPRSDRHSGSGRAISGDMMREAVPDDIRRFVLTSISSVPYLEAMLLLRSAPDTPWDATQVARRLYIAEKSAGELLSALHAANVVRATTGNPPAYVYEPASDDLRNVIDRLADVYAARLKEVTNLIHSRIEKQAQQFADAFRLRQEP